MEELLSEYYAGCHTHEEFEAARQRYNLWTFCLIDPVGAADWMEKKREAVQ